MQAAISQQGRRENEPHGRLVGSQKTCNKTYMNGPIIDQRLVRTDPRTTDFLPT
jgi:hypothetical protein